jgi:predicted DNA-binding protein (MmcQ/YjbR family)
MDNERIREICLALPHAAETLNWGHHLVYWAGDRDIGGKMFAMTDLDGTGTGVLWFHCGAERFHELLERGRDSCVATFGARLLGDRGAVGCSAAARD